MNLYGAISQGVPTLVLWRDCGLVLEEKVCDESRRVGNAGEVP